MNTTTQPFAVQAAVQAQRWLDALLDLLYPPRCGGCGAAGEGLLCVSCQSMVQRLPRGDQTRLLRLAAPYEGIQVLVTSAALFVPPMREAIHALKYEGVPHMAGPLALFIAEAWRESGLSADVIVPVPLHPRRQRERGYNQSERLAQELSALIGVPVDRRAVARRRHTEQQVLLGAEARRRNVQGAFAAMPARVNGKQIVVVDDVFTTGATLGECVSALLGAGAAHVHTLTLARAN
jgi:ComF family protein